MAASERMLDAVELPDRYEPIRRIATGGMASVWCAHDRVLGRRVAIKLLSERLQNEDAAVRRFKREARTAARLSGHPHVVTIFDVGETEARDRAGRGRAFIVMEYLPGGTVADAVRLGAVTLEEATRWVREVAAALDYAHAQGVLHRDIKLANLLLDRSRVLHVADFGIARAGSEDTITGSNEVIGTAAYLAPERALGQPATSASDRYSLAIAAFELLAGTRPFTAKHFAAQARAHLEEARPSASERNPSLPPAVDAVLARGMAKRPGDRWPTAAAFADAIEDAVGRPIYEPPPPAYEPPIEVGRPQVPRRAIAFAALAAAAFGVGVTVGASRPENHARTRLAAGVHPAVTSATRRPVAAKPPRPRAQTSTANGIPSATTTPPPTADQLEARGHSLMESGSYEAAIGVLRQAVQAAPANSLTYAYALYDLGRSLRLAGDPRAAIPVLWRRMQLNDQTGVVRNELRLALEALGASAGRSGGAPAPPAPPGSTPGFPGPVDSPGHRVHRGDAAGGGGQSD
jgi:eukaryotic-like serine/threonine-protein kinase